MSRPNINPSNSPRTPPPYGVPLAPIHNSPSKGRQLHELSIALHLPPAAPAKRGRGHPRRQPAPSQALPQNAPTLAADAGAASVASAAASLAAAAASVAAAAASVAALARHPSELATARKRVIHDISSDSDG